MKTLLRIIKALGDRNRVRIVLALGRGELCVCQIVELISLAHSTVSKHLSILVQADVVEGRKDGRWVYYRLVDDTHSLASKVAIFIIKELERDETALEDKAALARILRVDTEKLCCLQKKKREA